MGELALVDGFQIIQKLGSGGYGEIYSVRSNDSSELMSLKTECIEASNRAMANELIIIPQLPNMACFPHIIAKGATSAVNYFVMPLYGPNLYDLRRAMPNEKFSLPTSMRLAVEMFKIIRELHKSGIIHCDIKPSNFLLNKNGCGILVLIDYGLSTRIDEKASHHLSEGFKGTLKYASLNIHRLEEPARRDDLISWFYAVIEMVKGNLPWKDVRDKNLAMTCKQSVTMDKLCSGLPSQIAAVWGMIKDLRFEETPDYDNVLRLLNEIVESNHWNDIRMDWEGQTNILQTLTPYPELFDEETAKKANKQKPEKQRKRPNGECLVE